MNDQKEYINDITYNIKNVFSLKDDLDNIIKKEYEKAFEILDKYNIIEDIKEKYNMNYEKPEIEILEDPASFIGAYFPCENKIVFSKKTIEREIDGKLGFLSYYKEIKRSISDIEYLNKSYNPIFIFLYPLYINEKNIRESIAESIIRSTMFHEIWHSIDYSILHKLEKDPTIKDRDYLLTILNDYDNRELRASAFEVVMYYLVNGFHKNEKGYGAVYSNIPKCRKYIEKIDKLENDNNIYVPYDLGFCYGNIVVDTNKFLLEKNIYNIIDDILHLNKEKSIEVINRYGDTTEMLLYD